MDTYSKISSGLFNSTNSTNSSNSTSSFKNQFSNFGSNKYVSGTKDFLQSNNLVAIVTFIIAVVIGFVLLLRVGTAVLSWFFSPNKNPKLIDGMKIAKKAQVVKQDPKISSAKPILRSVNETDGIEFTYSVWMFIDDLEYKKGQYKHVFHKGNDNFSVTGDHNGINEPNNGPGLYIDKNTNNLIIIMNTFTNINEQVTVQDIPLNKWINVIIRIEGENMDVYINGTIVLRHKFNGVPKQNYGDIYVNMNGGYSGMLSDLWYHDYALTTTEILSLVSSGPNMKGESGLNVKPPYFSLRWYMNQ